MFVEDINKYRMDNSQPIQTSKIDIQSIKRKIKRNNKNIIQKFETFLQNRKEYESDSLNKRDLNQLFTKDLSLQLNAEENKVLRQHLDINDNGKIEIYELINFFVTYFGQKRDILSIYSKLIANYLDQKNQATEELFKKHAILEEMQIDKKSFVKKINSIFGIVESHADIFYQSLNQDQDMLQIYDLFQQINKFRKRQQKKTSKSSLNRSKIDDYLEKRTELSSEEEKQTPLKRLKPKKQAGLEQKELQEEDLSEDEQLSMQKRRNPLADQEDKIDFKIFAKKLQNVFSKYKNEFKNLDEQFFNTDLAKVSILQLRIQLSHFTSEQESKTILKYFKKADTDGDGFIDKAEWIEYSQEIGLERKKKKKKHKKTIIVNQEQFFDYITNFIKKQEIIIEEDIIFEVNELENTTISIVELKQYLKRKYKGKDIQDIITMLVYLDDFGNGFINYNEFKFLLVLLTSHTKQVKLDGKIFRDHYLNIRQLQGISNSEKINIFECLRKLIQFLDYEQEQQFGGFLHYLWNNGSRKDPFALDLGEFYELINYKSKKSKNFMHAIEEREGKLVPIIKTMRSQLQNKNAKVYSLERLLKDISETKTLIKSFNFYEMRKGRPYLDFKGQKEQFLDFILFHDISKLKDENLQLLNKVIKNGLLKSASQQDLLKSRSLKEDRFDLNDIAKDKILQSLGKKGNKKYVDQVLRKHFPTIEVNQEIGYFKFQAILKDICKTLKADEIQKYFQSLDSDGNRFISLKHIKQSLELLLKKSKQLTSKASLSMQKIKEKTTKNLKFTKTEKNVFKQLQKFKLKTEHYFQGKKTMFKNLQACLHVCSDYAQQLSNEAKKWDDPEFGPTQEDPAGQKSFFFDQPIPGSISPNDCEWYRPEQICIKSKKKPVFFDSEGASANDVLQGQLGDCWFIGALSILASDDELFFHQLTKEELQEHPLSDKTVHKMTMGVYPFIFHIFAKFGIYVFKFFKNYDWVYVMMDDKLPCFAGNIHNPTLVFASCHHKNEFWVPFLEKAYAKLHGNYQAIVGGQLDDGLVDMTGRVSEKLKIHDKHRKFNETLFKNKNELWSKIHESLKHKSMMGCSILPQKKGSVEGKVYYKREFIGLYAGHAYGMMDVFSVTTVEGKKQKLVRIRNPWGSGNPEEWNGKWSDNSPELIQNLDVLNRETKKLWGEQEHELFHAENKDGAFLMSYEDFIVHWSKIVICKKFPERFSGIRFFCEWSEENSFGIPFQPDFYKTYAKNSQFLVEVQNEETEIYISLAQEDGRLLSKGQEYFPFQSLNYRLNIGVFKVKGNKLEEFDPRLLVNLPPVLNMNRDTQVHLKLQRGKYIVVPATQKKDEFGRFFLSFYYDCDSGEIQISDQSQTFRSGIIQEEEEGIENFDENLKNALTEVLTQIK